MFNIRNAHLDDSGKLAAIGYTVWVTTYAKEGIRDSFLNFLANEFSNEHMQERIKKNQVLVVESGEHLCGYSVMEQPETGKKCELITFYLLPEFQGKGLGKTLLEAVKQQAPEGLWLSCYEGNKQALSFYKKQGLKCIGSRYFELESEKHLNWIFESQLT
ncbi:GNAT family N-acetyltransferase [Endozoicomonas numazuensis]|uniref:N-acetyltransferase domain-containing protein n=1 Tax=Endozoicomonas numazuensis TaxID=1137799 RepID=A0A081NMM2_9GAMM|nr:GNAT family N-acetyltransferase [Endozoicomonas numazuensis]KEQ19695.1 hypothetical protein GZ78_07400 [Endozoicomonas numazuensis]